MRETAFRIGCMAALCIGLAACGDIPDKPQSPQSSTEQAQKTARGHEASADKASPGTEAKATDPSRNNPWGHLLFPENVEQGKLSERDRQDIEGILKETPNRQGLTLLTSFGVGLRPYVDRLIDSEQPAKRAQGIYLVRYLNLTDFHDKISKNLKDPDARVRRAAVVTLGRLGDDQYVKLLEPSLKDAEASIRLASYKHMARAGERGVATIAKERAAVETRVWRLRALEALSEVALPEDAAWIKKELSRETLGFNDKEALWKALAMADPKGAVDFFKKNPPPPEEGMMLPERVRHVALNRLAGILPEEALVEEFQEMKKRGGFRVFRELVRGLAIAPGAQAASLVDEIQKGKRTYSCDIIGARLEAEQTLERRVKVYREALEGSDDSALRGNLAHFEKELSRLKPLAQNAGEALAARVKAGKKDCRGEITRPRPERLTPLIALTQDKDPKTRAKAARTLGKLGGWSHVSALGPLLQDENSSVRLASRDSLRLIIGIDLRIADGYLWEAWYERSFGAIPTPAFPVKDRKSAHFEDFVAEASKRPFPMPSIPSADPSDTGMARKGTPIPVKDPSTLPSKPASQPSSKPGGGKGH